MVSQLYGLERLGVSPECSVRESPTEDILRAMLCTRVYTVVYTWVYSCVHTCILLCFRYGRDEPIIMCLGYVS